jgi:hypothetical protein
MLTELGISMPPSKRSSISRLGSIDVIRVNASHQEAPGVAIAIFPRRNISIADSRRHPLTLANAVV